MDINFSHSLVHPQCHRLRSKSAYEKDFVLVCVCVCVRARARIQKIYLKIRIRAILKMHVSTDRVLTYIFFPVSLIFPSADSSYKTQVHVQEDIVPLSVALDRH
jgi:hypothetical protein